MLLSVLALFTLSGSACTRAEPPPRIILFIADGVGTSHWTAALLIADSLSVQQLPVGGLVDTRAQPQIITDSAAAATAIACGIQTYNGAIAMDNDGNQMETVLELAEAKGMATGLIATSSLTHATPAAFASHVPDRDQHNEIAAQIAQQGIDVLLGGGLKFFALGRIDDGQSALDLLSREYTLVRTAEDLQALDLDEITRLAGLFASDEMPRFSERAPTLPEMTHVALEILDRDPEGFFLMVEGSQPDWRAHDNEPLSEVVAEVLDLDRAVEVGLAYQRNHPNTLIVVTSDHETGGLAVEARRSSIRADYTTTGHTAAMVPIFAKGPDAGRFGGINPNFTVGCILRELVGH
jgi:alkaline phosphatase